MINRGERERERKEWVVLGKRASGLQTTATTATIVKPTNHRHRASEDENANIKTNKKKINEITLTSNKSKSIAVNKLARTNATRNDSGDDGGLSNRIKRQPPNVLPHQAKSIEAIVILSNQRQEPTAETSLNRKWQEN